MEQFLSVAQISRVLGGMSKVTVRRKFGQGEDVIRTGNGPKARMLIPESTVRKWMRDHGYRGDPHENGH